MQSTRRAFTLLEILIVVAIIAILAAIAVPNFLEAQIRAKVARVQADLRSFAVAVESYQVDHNDLAPRWNDENVNYATDEFQRNRGYYPAANTRIKDRFGNLSMALFTTPVAYISTLIIDPFEENPEILPENRLLDYVHPISTREYVARGLAAKNGFDDDDLPINGYSLLSIGPDGYFGHSTIGYHDYPEEPDDIDKTWYYTYDPTNGTTSVGNIYRFQSWPNDGTLWFKTR
jgi:prepilin-type N-terminal cleavage/methylation domain-containing protein